MSPHLPVTPAEIAQSAIEASRAGAAIVHLHARDPLDGRPTQDPGVYAQFLPEIARSCDAIINLTTGGSPILSLEQRLAPALRFQPELASLNMGSMNFGFYEMLGRNSQFKHDWERPYVEGSDDYVFRNTFRDIAYILQSCAEAGTRFEIECYDVGHLYTAAHFLDRGLLRGPLLIQTVFGIRGGIGAHPDDVSTMRRTADRLFGKDYIWSVLGAGRRQMPIAAMAAAAGGNVRVGLEDSLWGTPGNLATSNAEQVRRVREILSGLSLEAATPDEARAMLTLKGGSSTGMAA
jgi:uncharacterized protein (DUF849 family)